MELGVLTEEHVQQQAEAEIEETLYCDDLRKDEPRVPYGCPIEHLCQSMCKYMHSPLRGLLILLGPL